jgi:hypothetical protein
LASRRERAGYVGERRVVVVAGTNALVEIT